MTKKPKDLFFLIIALLLLGIIVKGFGPTFFIRKNENINDGHGPEGLPIYLIIHGLVMTTWILLLVLQSGLIQTNNTKLHMRLGWFGLVVAIMVIPTGILAINGFGPRLLALGVPIPVLRDGLSLFFWIDVFSLILFPSLFGAALYHRKNSDWHKRFIVYAGFTVLVPALARLTAQIAGTESFGGINWPLTWLVLFGIMSSIPIYDVVKMKRLQKATVISFISVFIGMLLAVLIASTEYGKDLASFQILDK
jgi:hypothetical protein